MGSTVVALTTKKKTGDESCEEVEPTLPA